MLMRYFYTSLIFSLIFLNFSQQLGFLQKLTDSQEEGIDVSHLNGNIDWNQVKTQGNKTFTFIKATEGVTFIDPSFQQNWENAGAQNIKRGAYHYFHSNDDPIQQAQFFIKNAQKGELPPVLDFESDDGVDANTVAANALKWLQYVEANFQKPIIYTYPWFGNTYAINSQLANYDLWIATYAASKPDIPTIWNNSYTYWQYAYNSTVPGITGIVDVDITK